MNATTSGAVPTLVIFGGQDSRLPDGRWIDSHPKIFGGRYIQALDGRTVERKPDFALTLSGQESAQR